jgi:SWIM zinc finger
MPVHLTEQSIAEMAPNDAALVAGRGLVKKGALHKLAKNDDGTLVFGLCKGSGKQPYELSMDLATGGDRPTLRCSCPSHQFPCKHQIGLMLAFVANGAAFPVQAPPAALLEKRAKLAEKAEKKAAAPAEAAPKKVDKAAAAKKAKEQSEGLDTLETFMVDLVGAGLGGLTAKSIKAIDTQAKRMADADMRKASGTLQRLSALVSADSDDDDDDDDDGEQKKAARGLSAERQAQIAGLVTQLWVTVRKGRKALEGKLEEGASQGEADAQVESILGRAWKLPELKEAGYWVTDRTLLELAHERSDDPVTEFQTASGYLLDLSDGSIVEEQTALPYQALKFGGKLRASRLGVLDVKEAALYPGEVVNRRVRWDEKADKVTERPRTPADYEAVRKHSQPLPPLVKLFRNQVKNPLNPAEAVVLLAVKRFGLAGDALVAEDEAGARLVLRDPRKAAFKTSLNLKSAAGAFGAGPLAVRLFFDPMERAVFGQALALFAGDKHLRLGM